MFKELQLAIVDKLQRRPAVIVKLK